MRVVELDGSSPLHWLLFRGDHPARGEGGGLDSGGGSISSRGGPAAAPGEDELGKFWELLDPDTQPIMPVPGCPHSQKIFDEHKEMARKYLVLQQEIYNLCQQKKELADLVSKEESRQLQKQSLYQDKIRQLQHKGDLLRSNHNKLREQLDKISGSEAGSDMAGSNQYHIPLAGPTSYPAHFIPLPRTAPSAAVAVTPSTPRLGHHDPPPAYHPQYYPGYHQLADPSQLPQPGHEVASPGAADSALHHHPHNVISAAAASSPSSISRARPDTLQPRSQLLKSSAAGHSRHDPGVQNTSVHECVAGSGSRSHAPLLTGPPLNEPIFTGPPVQDPYLDTPPTGGSFQRTAFTGSTPSSYAQSDYPGPSQGGQYLPHDQIHQPHQSKYTGVHKSHLNYPQHAPD